MPLPRAPTRRPNNPSTRMVDRKSNRALRFKGALCALTGLGAVLSPYFITAPALQGWAAKAALAGWPLLVLGCVLIGLSLRRRAIHPPRP